MGKEFIRVLTIDMNKKTFKIEERKDLLPYLGGVGVASKLLEENLQDGKEPLHESQPMIFAIGALSGIFPVVTKTVAMFVSPLTGELGESYAGGRMAMTMIMAGYDAMVITGKNDKGCYLSINSKEVLFKDARAFMGLNAQEIGRFIREREPGSGKRSILRIGPAGENLCAYANVCVDTYRHFGRLGLGAVMGSKNIKAISITGDREMPIKDLPAYLKAYKSIYKKATDTELMEKYHDLGTPVNVEPLSVGGGMPTLNLQSASFDKAENISGEAFAKKNLVRKMACTGCPVGCIHIGQYRKEFDKGYEYESVQVGYDYELIFSLGSFLGIDKTDEILELINKVEEMGLDAMSAGVALGWATEALSKGLISEKDTLVPLNFGDQQGYLQAIENIGLAVNEFYKALSQGVAYASSKYGGEDFAIAIAGNETSGYHTGYGSLVGAAVGARHSHLCNGGYSIDQSKEKLTNEQIAKKLYSEEVERCLLNSLIICLFARKVYDRETILMAMDSVGYTLKDEDLSEIARRIFETKQRIKKRLGFDVNEVKIPKRFFETPSMTGQLNEETYREILGLYQKLV